METRPIGATGERVTVVGLGGAALDRQSLADGQATVRRALDLGVSYFDTAPAYGRRASQVIVGTVLEGRSERRVLATKVGYFGEPAAFRSPAAIRSQLYESLQALRMDSVDLIQVHMVEEAAWWTDAAPAGESRLHGGEPYDFAGAPIFDVLHDAQDQGLCRFIGLTTDQARVMARVLPKVDVDVRLVAYGYNLMRRDTRAVIHEARGRGIACVLGAVFKPWFLAVRRDWLSSPPAFFTSEMLARLPRLYDIQRESGLSLVALTVRYLMRDPDVATILVGASTPKELEESVRAAEAGPLPDDLHDAVEALGVPPGQRS